MEARQLAARSWSLQEMFGPQELDHPGRPMRPGDPPIWSAPWHVDSCNQMTLALVIPRHFWGR